MKNNKIRAIAFYLPQFYPTPENDAWWEPGFTEWTNVAKAKPLFLGHHQPRIPRDLGFYDLRVPEVREQQAKLAKDAGIEGFCYWHYWFDGRRLLDRVFSEVVEQKKPDFPFCLCWANHSWYQKTWDPSMPDRLLIEQTYPGGQDYIDHFEALLPAFKDERYMKADGKLLFGIFDSDKIPNFSVMREVWNKKAEENGLPGFYFWGFVQEERRLQGAIDNHYDAIVYEHMTTVYRDLQVTFKDRIIRKLLHKPVTLPYSRYAEDTLRYFEDHPSLVPCLVPDFDHSPRSGHKWIIMDNCSPKKWQLLCSKIADLLRIRESENSLLFIKSWNEWGESNYLEPDELFGHGYLEATAQALNSSEADSSPT